MINNKKVSVIITAGGNGTRFSPNKRKQYFVLAHKSILEWTVSAFYNHTMIDNIVLVVPLQDLNKLIVTFEPFKKKLILCTGSDTRQASVFNGLQACPENTNIVLIHDGVRPFITQQDITEIIQQTLNDKAVIPVTKVKYTIKEYTKNEIVKTINRDSLVEVHTPQAFDYQTIYSLHKRAKDINYDFTDDASILEYFNHKVAIYFCSNHNIKITNQEDLVMARSIIKKLVKEGNYGI